MENLLNYILIALFVPTFIYFIKKIIDLKSSNLSIQSENSKIIKENRKFQKLITELESKVKLYEDRENILSKYAFDQSFGFWRLKSDSNHIICNSCINKFPPIEAPLKKEHEFQYICTIKECDQHYGKDDPNSPNIQNFEQPIDDNWLNEKF